MLNFNFFCCCLSEGLDPDGFDDEKFGKNKNPNSIQNGKWQLGFQGERIMFES